MFYFMRLVGTTKVGTTSTQLGVYTMRLVAPTSCTNWLYQLIASCKSPLLFVQHLVIYSQIGVGSNIAQTTCVTYRK